MENGEQIGSLMSEVDEVRCRLMAIRKCMEIARNAPKDEVGSVLTATDELARVALAHLGSEVEGLTTVDDFIESVDLATAAMEKAGGRPR